MDDLSAEYKQRIKFLYAGPLPAFNFVDVAIYPGMGEIDADGEGRQIHILHHSRQTSGKPSPWGSEGGNDDLYTISFNDRRGGERFPIKSIRSPTKTWSPMKRPSRGHEGSRRFAGSVCTILADEEKVKEVLEKAHAKIRDLLSAMAGKKSWG